MLSNDIACSIWNRFQCPNGFHNLVRGRYQVGTMFNAMDRITGKMKQICFSPDGDDVVRFDILPDSCTQEAYHWYVVPDTN